MKQILIILVLCNFSSSMAAEIDFRSEKSVYDCSDRIELGLSFSELLDNEKMVLIRWVSPQGRTQDSHSFALDGIINGDASANIWLELSRSKGSGVFSFIDPGAGMSDFIGNWFTEVNINGVPVGTFDFIVDC